MVDDKQLRDFVERGRRAQEAADELGLGSTGEFPEGQLGPDDEGGLQLAVGIMDGKVIVNFGDPVHWFGMGPEKAEAFARAVLDKARRIREEAGHG